MLSTPFIAIRETGVIKLSVLFYAVNLHYTWYKLASVDSVPQKYTQLSYTSEIDLPVRYLWLTKDLGFN